jgi:hypothetical protein
MSPLPDCGTASDEGLRLFSMRSIKISQQFDFIIDINICQLWHGSWSMGSKGEREWEIFSERPGKAFITERMTMNSREPENNHEMNVIFYSSTIDKRTAEICRLLEKTCPAFEMGTERHYSIGSLERRLRRPVRNVALLLLYLSGEKDLHDMISLQELIVDLTTVLIVTDTGKETITRARILLPRFIFGPNDSLGEMGLVFEKMLARAKERRTAVGHLS